MLFHSYTFLAFFTAVLALHQLSPQPARRWVLLLASYVFYASWNLHYASLILFSTLVDYAVVQAMIKADSEPRRRRLLLILSLVVNLGLLAIFKYYNFFAHSLADYFQLRLPLHELLLPVGISFYTFQSMSYTIDVYRRQIDPARDVVDFALFVSFFPQLVAGPIVRASEFLPQLQEPRRLLPIPAHDGLVLFIVGLFKKIVIADNLAILVDRVHGMPTSFTSGDLWVSAYAFAFQIYFDFSGYSDMAIGLALILGFRFPENFRRPYCAVNVSELWRRWHISLSTWLRDYLYISLGGNRGSRLKTLRNLMLTMVLGGLWHGANWTFVVWGFLHGAFLGIHRLFRSLSERVPLLAQVGATPGAKVFFVLLTFHCWVVSMVYFRAESIEVASTMVASMFNLWGNFNLSQTGGYLLLCTVLYAGHWVEERWRLVQDLNHRPLETRVAVLVVAMILMVLLKPTETTPFLYFQF